MIYRIKHDGDRYIAERKRWFGWQQLRGLRAGYWSTGGGYYEDGPTPFVSVASAEDAIKTNIIAAGIARAHTRVAKTIPPWANTTDQKEAK